LLIIWGVNPRTILRAINTARIKAVKIGRGWKITGQAVLDYTGYENIQIDALRLEQALIALDYGFTPSALDLDSYKTPFYNTSSEIIRITTESKTRGQMLAKLAWFIGNTRKPRLKQPIK